jgi:hypothetical protein
MGLIFDGSTRRLENPNVGVPPFPYSVGCLVRPGATGAARTVFSLSNLANTVDYHLVRITAAGLPSMVGRFGGTESTASTLSTVTVGAWHLMVARFISTSNRRFTVLYPSGAVESANSTVSRNDTTFDQVTIGALVTSGGASELFNGEIAEWWWSNINLFSDTAAGVPAAMMWMLRLYGPFAFPWLASSMVEYRSFRSSVIERRPLEHFHGTSSNVALNGWVNTGGVSLSQHPPLPYWYREPPNCELILA